ncbi:MAG: hypothetical protein WC307_04760 [Candidatus Nanoarchaeia archaeon]|jgi:tetrahydromethanopterin S-methyltransferase subunit B
MAKREDNGKVSVSAWNVSLKDINQRFDKLEKENKSLLEEIKKQSSNCACDKITNDLNNKISSKVSIKAWDSSLVDINNQINNVVSKDLKELDNRLDKSMELINNLTGNMSGKVTTGAWDKLCEDIALLAEKINNIEFVIKDAKVSEQELKKLLESI